ncbi:ScyD/ScyE family protein [Tunturiibacter empetritectus]|uniref:ScyD/ScyE family protein n=2 Tax=Tunturiibacter TaxID=3154218 RepID=A0A852VCR9_9BACT|nr:ScyD/ScyE family protein [Edaphobacter lichenicola]NYF89287.1 hypothetical protein [Edaphobacter lichenicola]
MKHSVLIQTHFVAAFAAVALLSPAVQAQLPVDASKATAWVSGLEGPRGLAFGPDGELYIAEAGTGGSNSTVGVCAQPAAPIGPYKGGTTARISKVDSHGTRSTLATGLPSALDGTGAVEGVADVAFLDGKLYAVLAGGGCAHANPDLPNGIVKVDYRSGKWSYVTDLTAFYQEHPAAYVASDFDTAGVPYAMIAHNDKLFVVEANHGVITATTPEGATHQVLDTSLAYGHVVPTSIASNGFNLYVGSLGVFPISPTAASIVTLSKELFFIDTTPGLETKPSELGKFRIANSRAGFTTIVSLKFGHDGLLYALELSDAPGGPAPGNGKVVRLDADGKIVDVVTGLNVPTGMAFGPDHDLYISNWGAGGPGAILRIRIP